MKLKDKEAWGKAVEVNTDPYGKACVDVARKVMEILDEGKEFDTHKIICQADDDIKMGGITGFMAGCVASMVSQCHARGEEFRRKWNSDNQFKDEGDKANESGGILNPALLNIST
ncbi:MAG: hypothetical protein V3U87_04170 [Methylococcaceae bacterium]